MTNMDKNDGLGLKGAFLSLIRDRKGMETRVLLYIVAAVALMISIGMVMQMQGIGFRIVESGANRSESVIEESTPLSECAKICIDVRGCKGGLCADADATPTGAVAEGAAGQHGCQEPVDPDPGKKCYCYGC